MSEQPLYQDPQGKMIDRFPNPHEDLDYQIELQAEMFSVLDPESGKPCYANLNFGYFPGEWCVEHPSLALYLLSYRQERMSMEMAIGRIAKDFAEEVDPNQLRLEATFVSRDGIAAKLIVPWPSPDEEEDDEFDQEDLRE